MSKKYGLDVKEGAGVFRRVARFVDKADISSKIIKFAENLRRAILVYQAGSGDRQIWVVLMHVAGVTTTIDARSARPREGKFLLVSSTSQIRRGDWLIEEITRCTCEVAQGETMFTWFKIGMPTDKSTETLG